LYRFVEAELKTCILVALLEADSHDANIAKATIAAVAAVTSQMLAYVVLAWNEPGSFFPCCADDSEGGGEGAVEEGDVQAIDLLVAAVRELRNGLVLPNPMPVASLRCCDDRQSVCVCYSDGSCSTVRPQILGGVEAENAAHMEAEIRETELSLLAEQAAEENPAELPLADSHEQSLRLLDRAVAWLRCDCFADIEAMSPLLASDAKMFSATGKANVLAFKERWLKQPLNYDVDVVHEVDLENRVVVVGFTSLLAGREGRGTDVIQFNEDLKVCSVDAIRHASVGAAVNVAAAKK
jgi:hypothetical protein